MAKKATKATSTKQATFITKPMRFEEQAKAFGTARMAKLSGYSKGGTHTKTAREAEKIYLGVVGYAELYGRPDQIAKAKALNPAKLRWMYLHKIITAEDIFSYSAEGMATPHKTYYITRQEEYDDKVSLEASDGAIVLRGSLDVLFYKYDKLNAEANRQKRESRRGKR